METVDIGGEVVVTPSLIYTVGGAPLGCFSRDLTSILIRIPADGIRVRGKPIQRLKPLQPGQSSWPGNYSDEFKEYMGLVGGSAGEALARMDTPEKLQHPLLLAAYKNSRTKLLFDVGMTNMVLFGDALSEELLTWTGHFARVLEEEKDGVLSCTHAVMNRNYPAVPRLCRVWAWTSRESASQAFTVDGPSLTSGSNCSEEAFEAEAERYCESAKTPSSPRFTYTPSDSTMIRWERAEMPEKELSGKKKV